jgi:hypothetical protein
MKPSNMIFIEYALTFVVILRLFTPKLLQFLTGVSINNSVIEVIDYLIILFLIVLLFRKIKLKQINKEN